VRGVDGVKARLQVVKQSHRCVLLFRP
jgi:hypothetical protein